MPVETHGRLYNRNAANQAEHRHNRDMTRRHRKGTDMDCAASADLCRVGQRNSSLRAVMVNMYRDKFVTVVGDDGQHHGLAFNGKVRAGM